MSRSDQSMAATSLSDDESARQVTSSLAADRPHPSPQLPVYLTPFIGREPEIAQAIELLEREDVRLLTLTGPGGIGKTRLALRLTSELAPRFSSGVCFVPLSAVTNPDMVLPTIARSIDVPDTGTRPLPEVLKTSLRDRRLLLILDNFEQVIDAAAQVTDLMAHCPGLNVIVTSRVVLHVQGEQEFAVPPLPTPIRGPGRTWYAAPLGELTRYDAIQLFVQRAQSVQPAFRLTDDNALAVSEICTRLDGLPLAIELAAARVKILPPSALLTRLSNRLQVLTGGARDQPARLRTMRNAIAWSYELLGETEQLFFQSLSVFAGGFTLDAAETVIGADELPIDALDGISTLMDSSLLREVDEPDSGHRFLMLSTIREYGLEQLAESGSEVNARKRHADWCLALAQRAEPELGRADMVAWLNRLEREHDNVRAALTWLIEQGDVGSCQRLTSAIWMFWFFRCYFREARGWMDRILAQMPDTPSSMNARTMVIAGVFAETVGDFSEAIELLEAGRGMAILLGDKECLGMAMSSLGDVADNLGQYEYAESLFVTAAELFRETNQQLWLVLTLGILGTLAQRRGDEIAAESLTNDALALSRQIGFLWGSAINLNRLGRHALNRADDERASRLFSESLALWHELGDSWRMSRTLIDLADLAGANQQFERAACLLGAAQAINEPIGASDSFVDDTVRQRALKTASENLNAEAFAVAWSAGRAMSWEEAIDGGHLTDVSCG